MIEIRFDAFTEPVTEFVQGNFLVNEADQSINYPIKFDNMLGASWKMNTPEIKEFILDYGLYLLYKRALRGSLREGGEIPFNLDNSPPEKPLLKKQCEFQKTDNYQFFCSAVSKEDELRGLTTIFACTECPVPSIHRRCSNMTNIKTEGEKVETTDGRYEITRKIIEYQCTKTENIAPIENCLPEKENCWVLIVPKKVNA